MHELVINSFCSTVHETIAAQQYSDLLENIKVCFFKLSWTISEKHPQLVVRPRMAGLRVRRADFSATLPPHGTIPELQQE